MKDNLYVYIMAGGIGSRFWPKSLGHYPKQFIDILGTGKSLLQMTAERFKPIISREKMFVITHDDYKQLVSEQLSDLPRENIICEPVRRNTAPSIAYAAFKLYKQNPDATMVIVPSDHLILKETLYLKKVEAAVILAEEKNGLVTLGIPPTRPDTGYGYIHHNQADDPISDAYKVNSFKEKPSQELADEYVKAGNYLWNAGMFIWKSAMIIKAFMQHSTEIYNLFQAGVDFYNTKYERDFINAQYPKATNISIDYAVMEKASNVYTIPAEIGWSDLGTWNSLYEIYGEKDNNANALIVKNAHITNSRGCIISAPKEKLVVIDGLEDYIIVDDSNVLLIYPRKSEQKIKDVTTALKLKGLHRYM